MEYPNLIFYNLILLEYFLNILFQVRPLFLHFLMRMSIAPGGVFLRQGVNLA